jgi:RecA/RadA recombinase
MNCENCGNIFIARRATARYCSDRCRVYAKRGVQVVDNPMIKQTAKEIEQMPDKTPKKITSKLAKAGFSVKSGLDIKPIEFVTSGVPEIDDLVGGIPKGRITEIYGMQGVGKTTLMTMCVSNMSKTNKVLYIDAENAFNPHRALELGLDLKNIEVSDTYIVEDVIDLTIEAVDSYDIVVIDSLASLVPRAEDDGNTGDMFMGLKARLMGQFMRKLVGKLGRSDCAAVFINQLRETMEIYGPKKSTPGGHALPYAASLRLELSTTKADRIRDKDGGFKGHKVTVEVTKSKVSRPHQKTQFKIDY